MKSILIKAFLLAGGMLSVIFITAQELYVFTEPASNMPAHSLSAKVTSKYLKDNNGRVNQRYIPEIMVGLNKKWMLHGAISLSDMFSSKLRWESAKVYAKYRIFSTDDVHSHFRVSAFSEISKSRNELVFDELSFDGDQSGAQGGFIATQLKGKLALSSTVSYLHVLTPKPKSDPDHFSYNAINYSLSAGYLVLPFQYKTFRQTNLNIYTELLGQRSLDMRKYAVDLAPAVQLIFNSNSKLNLGYRFQLNGNMNRMANQSWLISFETTFLDAFK